MIPSHVERELRAFYAARFFDPRSVNATQAELVARAFECWREHWASMMRELTGRELACTDDFSRQHQIGVLENRGDVVGLFGYRELTMRAPYACGDSYFRSWPKAVLEAVANRWERVAIGSNLVVAPSYRSGSNSFRVSEALLALAASRFASGRADVLVGTMRRDRGMSQLALSLGATPIFAGAIMNGVPVDLVTFERGRISTRAFELASQFQDGGKGLTHEGSRGI